MRVWRVLSSYIIIMAWDMEWHQSFVISRALFLQIFCYLFCFDSCGGGTEHFPMFGWTRLVASGGAGVKEAMVYKICMTWGVPDVVK
jgi:hypothetical protein